MPVDDRAVAVVRGWVAKAENDLRNAAHALKLGKMCPTDTVGFHARQCVEKYLKALLAESDQTSASGCRQAPCAACGMSDRIYRTIDYGLFPHGR